MGGLPTISFAHVHVVQAKQRSFRDGSCETGMFALAREGRGTIKQHWNKGSGVLGRGRGGGVSNKSLLGSLHSRVHANDMEIGCFFCSFSILPGLIHTCSWIGGGSSRSWRVQTQAPPGGAGAATAAPATTGAAAAAAAAAAPAGRSRAAGVRRLPREARSRASCDRSGAWRAPAAAAPPRPTARR